MPKTYKLLCLLGDNGATATYDGKPGETKEDCMEKLSDFFDSFSITYKPADNVIFFNGKATGFIVEMGS